MNLAFGILSSSEPPAAVAQLIDSLGPRSSVWVHHDPTKGPLPSPVRDDVRFVRNPQRTAWGEWSLCAAILKVVREALAEPGWDYFQLLSGSCLPVRPLDEFARYVRTGANDAHMDMVALRDDDDAMMSHGFRAYAPQGTLGHRVLRRMRRWYVGEEPDTIHRAGLSFAVPPERDADGALARVARAGMRRVRDGATPGLAHPFDDGLDCYVGSTWWGARRHVCEYLVDQPEDGALQRYARRMLIPDEFYFQTVMGNSRFARGVSNHWITPFDGPHPMPLARADLPALWTSRRFFARKFSGVAGDPARRAVLSRMYAMPDQDRRRLARAV